MTPAIVLPPLVVLPPLPAPELVLTPWFPVSLDGWYAPVYAGWYDWRRIGTGDIDRLWWNAKTGRVMAVPGHCPPLAWDAWRGVLAP